MVDSQPIRSAKAAMRAKARLILPTITDISTRSASIADKAAQLPEYLHANTIFVYLSVLTEPSTDAIITDAFESGKRVFVPRCRKDEPGIMDAVEIYPDTVMVPGAFGIREPDMSYPAASEQSFDCTILPCAAAGEDMGRLGHGAGYYDRFLAYQSGAKIMLCFDDLVFPSVPRDSFDIDPDIIITETRTLSERTY